MLIALFLTLFLCLLLSVPVSFSVGISTVVFLLTKGFPPLVIVSQRMIEGIDSFPLMALPLFILSGELMALSCTPRLMRLANLILGRVPGGLAATATVSCGLFGTISGSGIATTAAIGGILAPEMNRAKYAPGFTASLLAGAGVLGGVIPPSFTMVIYGATGGVSIGDLFMAGFIPGILAVGALVTYCMVIGHKRNYYTPVPATNFSEKLHILIDALLPLFMPFLILGGVMSGVFTPTESAMIAVLYAFTLEMLVYRKLKFKGFVDICVNSAIFSAIILFIMSVATPFGWIMATENVPKIFADGILSIASHPLAIYFLIMMLLVVLGTFMEGVSLIILLTPILMPMVVSLGMDPVQFGVILILAMAVGGVTPPLALNLYVAARVVGIGVEDTFPEVLYVVGILVAVLSLTVLFPELSLYLPSLMR